MNSKLFIALLLLVAAVSCTATRHRANAVRDRLSDTRGLSAHTISIDEEAAGVITLNGNVASSRDRDTIEEVARDTNGVKEVQNNLIVNSSHVSVDQGDRYSSSDRQSIARDVISGISASPQLRDYDLNVDVDGGAVTLHGEVSNQREWDEAERIARNTRGVSSVRNELVINRDSRNDNRISQDVRDALRRRTDIDLRDIDIQTRDSVVILRGTQSSNRDIDYLVSSARTVSGVRGVRNEIVITGDGYADRLRVR